jgi:hypothetical protein
VACASCTSLGLVDQLAMRGSRCLACGDLLAPGLAERAARGGPFAAAIGTVTRSARIVADS